MRKMMSAVVNVAVRSERGSSKEPLRRVTCEGMGGEVSESLLGFLETRIMVEGSMPFSSRRLKRSCPYAPLAPVMRMRGLGVDPAI